MENYKTVSPKSGRGRLKEFIMSWSFTRGSNNRQGTQRRANDGFLYVDNTF